MIDMLKIVDDRQRNNGDWRASAYLEQKEKDKVDVVYETEYFRRSSDQKFMILFTKPKSSAGQGYLRIDKNLWFYDPSVGKWERRTERERIGGTNSRRSDFDESRLAEEYDPTDEGEEKLGAYTAQKLLLKGKAGLDLRLPDDPHLGRQGHQERAQAPGVRAVGPAAAHVVLPEVEEALQRVEEGRRLVPGGDPLLRRGREGEPDAGPDQGRRPAGAAREPVHEGLAREQEPLMCGKTLAALRRCCSRGPVRRGRRRAVPATRTSSAARSPRPPSRPPRNQRPRSRGRRSARPWRRPRPRRRAPTAASEPPARGRGRGEALGTERDQSVLGNTGGEAQHLSDYQAPENPLQIGGQLYLRTQSTALPGDAPDRWSLNAPSLLDAYFDARPNPRVRAFILGRMSYNPTAAPSAPPRRPSTASRSGARARSPGGSPTGFTTFTAARGPTSVLDQMWIRFDVAQRVFVTAGKQHVRWGTGRFWQPTDYLHLLKRNPLDVFDARQGTSMLKLHLPWEERAWNFYAFGVFEDPNLATNNLRRLAGAARAEIVLGSAEIGLDAFVKRDQKPRFGIDFSAGIWDFDVYADVGHPLGRGLPTSSQISAVDDAVCTDRAPTRTMRTVPTDRSRRRTTRCSRCRASRRRRWGASTGRTSTTTTTCS